MYKLCEHAFRSTVLVAFLTILSPAVAYSLQDQYEYDESGNPNAETHRLPMNADHRKKKAVPCCCLTAHFTVKIERGHAEIVLPISKVPADPHSVGQASCYAFLCRTTSANSDCIRGTKIRIGYYDEGCMSYILLSEFSGNVYVKANCTSNEKKLGETEWLPIFIPAVFVVSAEEDVETEQKPVVQPPVKDAFITMKVTAVVRIQLIWDIEMRNGDPFIPSVLKSITVKRHHLISAGDYDDGIVISNDLSKHVIDDGLSPGYNFRWTCYLYSIDVTFQNDRHAYKEVERCFSLFSPSFVFLLGAISISIVLCIQFKAVATEDTEHTQRALRRFRRLRI
ncbi:hypothetical protein V3C99_011723 [Haemonchus contortus]